MNKSEFQIQKEIAYWLQGQRYIVAIEVPIVSLIPDISAYDLRNDRVMTVEVKISNWKKVIRQVLSFYSYSDYLVVAVAAKKVPQNHYDYCREKGVGIIIYDNHPKWILKPRLIDLDSVLDYYRNLYIDRIRKNPAPINGTIPFYFPREKAAGRAGRG